MKTKMQIKYKRFIILIFVFGFLFNKNISFAEGIVGQCSKDGYTVLTINGVLTDEDGAKQNMRALKDSLTFNGDTYNNQKITVDYLSNPSHLGGALDLRDAIAQGDFEQKSDYDLTNILLGASQKIRTQKVLVVGHSQGNFYANNFYDTVTKQAFGIPNQSIGVYAVATPANRVAGVIGKPSKYNYTNSSTDNVIYGLAGNLFQNKLIPNTDISEVKSRVNPVAGHDFVSVYLTYRPTEIISGIQASLKKLQTNNLQNVKVSCMNAPDLNNAYIIKGAILSILDHPIESGKTGLSVVVNSVGSKIYNTSLAIGNIFYNTSLALGNTFRNLSANVVASLPDTRNLSTILPNVVDSALENNSPQVKTAEATPPPINSASAESSGDSSLSAPVTEDINNSGSIENNADTEGTSIIRSGGGGGGGASPVEPPAVSPLEVVPDIIPPVIEPDIIAPPPSPPPLNTTTISENTTLAPGEYNYDNLIITNNAVLTLEGDPTSPNDFKGVKINAVNITIDAGSSISADGKGYGPNAGPGVSLLGNVGASYGGVSLNGLATSTYGSAMKPVDLGSGGAHPYHGGGAMQIVVSDTFTNNGIISSDGGSASSGGSIYITAKNITGSGTLHANGGSLYGSGYFKSPGGGGRIAIYYETSSFSGIAEAKGGCGSYDGFSASCGQNGTVGFVDTINNNLYVNNSWQFVGSDSPFSFNNIFISNGAKVAAENNTNITANNILIDDASSFTLADNQILNIPTITLDGGATLTLSGSETITANTLTITGNSTITVLSGKILSLTIPNINIAFGSSISADAKGYNAGIGTGVSTLSSAGASYGGIGYGNNETSSSTYGSGIEPTDFGSGGASSGGGAIRIIVSEIFNNDGIVSADGNVSSSGGSVYITANNIIGNGIFRANGGNLYGSGYFKGPGGGGRVAIYYETSSFSGTVEAKGGCGSYNGYSMSCGQDGTVHIVDESIVIIPLPPILSSEKIITTFNFSSLTPNVVGVVDEAGHTISLTVPFGTDVRVLAPTITISEKASINPNVNVIQDFTSPVIYTVTAEDGSTQNYIVTVTVEPEPTPEPEPEPEPDTTSPTITSYTLNGTAGDITTNPSNATPLSIILNASKNVDWVSIKIEKEDDSSIYKYYYPGDDCDGSSTCTENWNGILSSGGLLQNGTYKIKVRLRDLVNEEIYDFVSPYIITVNTSI